MLNLLFIQNDHFIHSVCSPSLSNSVQHCISLHVVDVIVTFKSPPRLHCLHLQSDSIHRMLHCYMVVLSSFCSKIVVKYVNFEWQFHCSIVWHSVFITDPS